jgi:deoxyribose-phosphate aldolase
MASFDEIRSLARVIEHALLKAEATAADIERLCQEATTHHFHGVCVNGTRVAQAYGFLADSEVKVVTVVGFPLGAMDSDAKRYEVEASVDAGAHELDVVLNVGRLKDGDHSSVLRELRDIVESADERPVKVILETCLLTREEKVTACRLVLDSGAQFVKTSTGFSKLGATIKDVELLRETVGPTFGVKASGGIRDAQTALRLLEAGATRLGTSSSVAIIESLAGGRAGCPDAT